MGFIYLQSDNIAVCCVCTSRWLLPKASVSKLFQSQYVQCFGQTAVVSKTHASFSRLHWFWQTSIPDETILIWKRKKLTFTHLVQNKTCRNSWVPWLGKQAKPLVFTHTSGSLLAWLPLPIINIFGLKLPLLLAWMSLFFLFFLHSALLSFWMRWHYKFLFIADLVFKLLCCNPWYTKMVKEDKATWKSNYFLKITVSSLFCMIKSLLMYQCWSVDISLTLFLPSK